MLFKGNFDVHLTDVTLLTIVVIGLDLRQILHERQTALGHFAHFYRNGCPSNLVQLLHLDLLYMHQGRWPVEWCVACSHHLHPLLELHQVRDILHLLQQLRVAFDLMESFVVEFERDIHMYQRGHGNFMLGLLLNSDHFLDDVSAPPLVSYRQSSAPLGLIFIVNALCETHLQDNDDSLDFEELNEDQAAIHIWRPINAADVRTDLLYLFIFLWLQVQLRLRFVLVLFYHCVTNVHILLIEALDILVLI